MLKDEIEKKNQLIVNFEKKLTFVFQTRDINLQDYKKL
jgi:thymidylate synthase